jgi:dimeric dUTPase (all-alpha-NTP-PPase superfamily)
MMSKEKLLEALRRGGHDPVPWIDYVDYLVTFTDKHPEINTEPIVNFFKNVHINIFVFEPLETKKDVVELFELYTKLLKEDYETQKRRKEGKTQCPE